MKAEEIKKVLSHIYLGLTLKHEVACKEAIKAVEKTEPRPVIYESDGFADGAPVSRASLASLLGKAAEGNLPDVHICAIRKKLSAHRLEACIQTVRGKGYRLFTDLLPHETERNRTNDE